MSIWYFCTALIKAPRHLLSPILQAKEPNARVIFNDLDRAVISESGRHEGLSDWIYDMGVLEHRATILVSWSVEAVWGEVWAMRNGRIFNRYSYQYEDEAPTPKPVSFVQKVAAALELELIALQSALRLAARAAPIVPAGPPHAALGKICMHTYSFRAESAGDVDRLSLALRSAGISNSMEGSQVKDYLPAVEFQLCANASLETIRSVMRGVEEADLMAQTLRAGPLREATDVCGSPE